jgi:RNA polymerase sigma-70 factor (ECF subfamily)
MSPTPKTIPDFDFKRELMALIPLMRAFARSLCQHPSRAEDLAQDALVKAWKAQASFQVGTNLKAWLFTILRNEFYSRLRREWRQMPWDQESAGRIPAPAQEQQWHLALCDVAEAMRHLPTDQREALILVGAAGFSYAEAAEICAVPQGTVKSRVARARQALLGLTARGGRPAKPLSTAYRQGGIADIMAQLAAIVPQRMARQLPVGLAL